MKKYKRNKEEFEDEIKMKLPILTDKDGNVIDVKVPPPEIIYESFFWRRKVLN